MGAKTLTSRAILGQLFLRLQMGAAGWVNDLSMAVDSDQMSEEHRWLGMSPQMREWIGGRLVHGLREQGITIRNVEFEATVEVLVRELRLDKTGQIMQRINGLADRANSHGAKLLSELIIAGESTVAYDGQFFFDTDHVEGSSGTQSNDITHDVTTPASPTAAEMTLAVLSLISQLYSFKDDQGEPLNEGMQRVLILTPTSLWGPTLTGVTSERLAGGETNPLNNVRSQGLQIEVRQNPRLTWTDKIVGFRADGGDGGRPFIRQEEKPLDVSAQAEGSPEEFNNKRHLYGVDWTGNYGYGFWQHACLQTLV